MTHLETIREACVKANPEIMELGFGCEVQIKQHLKHEYTDFYRGDIVRVGSGDWVNCSFAFNHDESDYTILGRPIRLADVLLSMKKDYMFIRTGEVNNGGYKITNLEKIVTELWNLRKDNLSDQSPECLEFLSNLLK